MGETTMDGEHSREYGVEIDLQVLLVDLLRSALRFWWVEVVLVLLCAGVLCFRTHQTYSPQYRAEASFTVYVTNPLQAEIQSYNSATAEQMAKTFPYILTSSALSDLVREELGIGAIPGISASTVENTNIFTLSVTASDPQLAYDVLNAVITYYPEVAEYVVGPTKMSLLDESGVPTQPTNQPDYLHTALRGVVVGTVLWLAILFLIAVARSTVHNEKQLKQMMNLPCLGLLPKAKGYGKGRKIGYPVMIHDDELMGFAESVRLLRLRVEKELRDRGKKVLLVSSAIPGEGKTTVAANLAIALARSGKKTLLLDCDLRNPSVGKVFGQNTTVGLAEYLQGKVSTKEIFQCPIEGIQLIVVYGGKSTGEAAELISKHAAKEFMDTTREVFDYVIIDTPPLGNVIDSAVIAEECDGAILVIESDVISYRFAQEVKAQLEKSNCPILGVVLNKVDMQKQAYGKYGKNYGKYYGDYARKQEK